MLNMFFMKGLHNRVKDVHNEAYSWVKYVHNEGYTTIHNRVKYVHNEAYSWENSGTL